jgi:hypothetical protein
MPGRRTLRNEWDLREQVPTAVRGAQMRALAAG